MLSFKRHNYINDSMKAKKITARQAFAGTVVGACIVAFAWIVSAFLKR
jgi:hypothetical protein